MFGEMHAPITCPCPQCVQLKCMAVLTQLVDDAGGELTFDMNAVGDRTENISIVFDVRQGSPIMTIRVLTDKELEQHNAAHPVARTTQLGL